MVSTGDLPATTGGVIGALRPGNAGALPRSLVFVAAGVGAAAHLLQILLLRESYALGLPGEVGMTLAMLAWLAGGTAGALAARHLPAPLARPRWLVPGMLLAGGAGILGLRALFAFGLEAGRVVPDLLPATLSVVAASAGPAAVAAAAVTGLLREAQGQGRGRVLAADCVGASVAGVLLCAGALARFGPLPARVSAALWAGALPGARLRAEVELPGGRLTILERSHQLAVYRNGRLAGWLPATDDERDLVLPALAEVPPPRRVLLPEADLGAFLPTVLAEDVAQVTAVVRERAAPEALASASPLLEAAWADPRTTVLVSDPRRALRALPAGSVEVALLPEARAASAGENRLFTVEAFRELRRLLSPDGVVALTLPVHPGGQASPDARAAASVLRALEQAFPGGVVCFGGGPVTAMAGHRRPSLDAASLAARLPGTVWGSAFRDWLTLLFDADAREAGHRALARVDARANSDRFPWALGESLRARLAAHASRGALLSLAAGLAALFTLGLLLVCRRAGSGPGMRATAAGAAALLAWGLSLYLFQVARGALYREVGAVGASCLLGMALGATLRPRAAGRWVAAASLAAIVSTGLPPGGLATVSALATGFLANLGAGGALAGLLERCPEHPGAIQAGDLLGATLSGGLVTGLVLAGPGPLAGALALLLLAPALGRWD